MWPNKYLLRVVTRKNYHGDMKHQWCATTIRLCHMFNEKVYIYVLYMCMYMRECILFNVITNDELDMIEISIY